MEIIEDTHMSLASIAELAGYHKNVIYYSLKRGTHSPAIQTLESIAAVVGAEIVVRKINDPR